MYRRVFVISVAIVAIKRYYFSWTVQRKQFNGIFFGGRSLNRNLRVKLMGWVFGVTKYSWQKLRSSLLFT